MILLENFVDKTIQIGMFSLSVTAIVSFASKILGIVFWSLALFLGLKFIKKIPSFLKKYEKITLINQSTVVFLISTIKFILKIICFFAILSILGIDITKILTLLGASLVTISVTLRDGFYNFISGIILITSAPFKVGNKIEIDGKRGTVTKIEMIFTSLKSETGEVVNIPNVKFMTTNFVILDLN